MALNTVSQIIGNKELTVPSRNAPGYEPDIIELATLDDLPEELQELRVYLREFLKVNKDKWSLSTLARFLNTDSLTLSKLLPFRELQGFNSKAQTILVLKPRSDLEQDELLYQVNKL
jgi:hypothetical protein